MEDGLDGKSKGENETAGLYIVAEEDMYSCGATDIMHS